MRYHEFETTLEARLQKHTIRTYGFPLKVPCPPDKRGYGGLGDLGVFHKSFY